MAISPAVIDTNVVVSGFITKDAEAPTARINDGMLRSTFPFLLSDALLREYRNVLLRPAIVKLHKRSVKEIDEFLAELITNGMFQKPAKRRDNLRDTKDSHVVELALSVKSAVVVSGDDDLLDASIDGLVVITPRAFVDSWESSKPSG